MRLLSVGAALVLMLAAAAPAKAAPDPGATELANALRPLLPSAAQGGAAADWTSIEGARAIRWGQGPVMLAKPSPDGNYFARPGQTMVQGRPVTVVAAGARTMVFSYYIRDPGPATAAAAIVEGFQQAGFRLTPARCPIDPSAPAPRHWYRVTVSGKGPAFLYAGPLNSGGQGYTLFVGDALPPMTQSEATIYTDDCGAPVAAGPSAAAGARPTARPTTGQAGVAALIEALMRPVGAPASVNWTALPTASVVTWKGATPMKMSSPYTDGGADSNPRLLEGDFKTATTRMSVVATGDDRTANRFLLRDGGHLPPRAVFDLLGRDGYVITPLRCGKPYTEMSDAFFRISAPGKQPAILYRAIYKGGGQPTETYGLRLDNALPAVVPGQTAAPAAGCPG